MADDVEVRNLAEAVEPLLEAPFAARSERVIERAYRAIPEEAGGVGELEFAYATLILQLEQDDDDLAKLLRGVLMIKFQHQSLLPTLSLGAREFPVGGDLLCEVRALPGAAAMLIDTLRPRAAPISADVLDKASAPLANDTERAKAGVHPAAVPAAIAGDGAAAAAPPAEPAELLNDRKGLPVKREALIERHRHRWTSIERDLKDASSNKLRIAAKADDHGFWWEEKALDWARARGKLQAQAPVAGLASVVHRMGS